MKYSAKKLLDKELAIDKRNGVYGAIIVLVVVIIFGCIFIPFSSNTVYGKTITYTARQIEYGSFPRVKVELESGQRIVAKLPGNMTFKYGHKVEILERKTLFGKPIYNVTQYVQ